MKSLGALVVLAVITLIGLKTGVYILAEDKQAIITEFGKPMGEPIVKPGVHFKVPWQKVTLIEKRILTWDGDENIVPTLDKKYIKVDTTARWQIIDPLKFIQTVQNERRAKTRIDTIIDSKTRDFISNHNLVEAVRNSNDILKLKEKLKESESIDLEEITVELEKIKVGREQLSAKITEESNTDLLEFGINIIDVQLRRISYEESVEVKVYERMVSERKRIAEKILSIGKGEKAKIEGRLSKDLQKIESGAYKVAQQIRGKADAKAIKIYASALKKGPAFYEFMRTMEAYKKSLKKDTKLILSSDSQFLKYLKANR